MIGRLVEQQQVRLLHKQPRQIRAHHPAAAHRLQRPVEIAFAKRQPVQNALRFGFELLAEKFSGFRRDRRRQLQHRLRADRRRFLREMADRGFPLDRHLARVRGVVTENQ